MSPALSARFRRVSTTFSIQAARSLHFLVLAWFLTFIVIHVDAGNGAAAPAEAAALAQLARYRTEDHDRIARGLTDVVIHRIFAAGLDLQAALGLIGDHAGSGKICHAIDELDHAIKDIREIIYDRSPGESRPFPRPGGSRAGA